MALDREKKEQIIKEFSTHSNDTGSMPVQIALLTQRINYLSEHFKKHPKDYHSRRGFIKLIAKRRKYLQYLKKNSPEKYKELIRKLNISGA